MPASRRTSRHPQTLALIAAMAIVLAGCGIKSALEPPRASNQSQSDSADGSRPVPEQSVVQSGPSFSLLPPENPVEWEKEKKEMRAKRSPARPSKSTAPDKPFILDSLL